MKPIDDVPYIVINEERGTCPDTISTHSCISVEMGPTSLQCGANLCAMTELNLEPYSSSYA
jgi:hypothetical protein